MCSSCSLLQHLSLASMVGLADMPLPAKLGAIFAIIVAGAWVAGCAGMEWNKENLFFRLGGSIVFRLGGLLITPCGYDVFFGVVGAAAAVVASLCFCSVFVPSFAVPSAMERSAVRRVHSCPPRLQYPAPAAPPPPRPAAGAAGRPHCPWCPRPLAKIRVQGLNGPEPGCCSYCVQRRGGPGQHTRTCRERIQRAAFA